ncbi:alkaline phosphatase [Cellulophaga sp. 20_2_10]|uniref:alkaline phosphatase n=1 Tax=Cellulophaga sp. 20_2_10 TaxID=2942476 RepID=UPI00201AAA21|nr:alkaline phosphatase [Cellulophaga sp. 20_2_10]MCL5246132.1 alkaline phosphatase [Cellulophaga sp. 20_2_10]
MFAFKKKCIILAISFFSLISFAQKENQILIHSHNDYLQNVPFWNAFSSGATIVEADVWLKNNALYIAHTENEILENNTLQNLYLKPLQQAVQNKQLSASRLILMIDVKSNAEKTLKRVISVIKKYPELIAHNNIEFLISGNRPQPNTYHTYPNYISFDHQELTNTLSPEDWDKVAMVSTSFKKYSDWNGKGRLTHTDYDKVTAAIKKAKELNKPFRFWATPDSKTAWKTFVELGVAVINTDEPYKCVSYVKTLEERTTTAIIASKVYMPTYVVDNTKKPIKNVILMIGDGMGLSQISSAVLANNGSLTLTQLKSVGLIKTQSADDLITDSAAAGTALATGQKTNNRAIGTDVNGKPLPTLVDILATSNFSTGIITTDQITGATPSSFYAKQKDRGETQKIAEDLLKTNLHFFAAGGANLYRELPVHKKFTLVNNISEINKNKADKLGVFLADGGVPSIKSGRGNLLAETTKEAIRFLKGKNKPFFLMVEAAQIDSFGHYNDTEGVVAETIDFDRAITEAIKFADKDGETLVIVTADHETGGLSVSSGSVADHKIEGGFVTHDHTGVMVPIFAYGPQSYHFSGVYENTEVFSKILKILEIEK